MSNPQYPVYIVSKKRADSRITSKALERINVPYHIVIDAGEYDQYAAVIDPKKILIMPEKYREEYDTFDDLGLSKAVGPGCARNFCWDHSIKNGFNWHWVLDDNISCFYWKKGNNYHKVTTGITFKLSEDFINRYTNIAIAGMQYHMFTPKKCISLPINLNTRVYSCLLIRNDIPYRWRGRYNEDTDLSLRVLKDGWCTLLFNAFPCHKIDTQSVKGGNTEQFYSKEGTLPKSEMQVRMHPDVSTLVWKFNRWHHHVDYRPFKNNKLIRKKDVEIPEGVNNYGMVLKKRTKPSKN